MVRIKICGITNPKDAFAAAELGAWALGFIFYKKSPRYVSPDTANKIIRSLPKTILPVGVFVNHSLGDIKEIAQYCRLRVLQFHGDQTPLFCQKFKQYHTIKAFRMIGRCSAKKILQYKTDYYLFDTYDPNRLGGTGKIFDWTLLKDLDLPAKKIILSGGLNPDNIHGAMNAVSAYAYDASSSLERREGKKCLRLLKKFFQQAKGD